MGISAVVGAVTAVSAYKGYKEQKKAAGAARESNERARRQEAIRAQRERVQALRQSRIQQAAATAFSINQGTQGASTTQGALASFQTQFASNSAFTEQINTLRSQQLNFQAMSDSATARAGLWNSIAEAAPKIGGFVGEINALRTK